MSKIILKLDKMIKKQPDLHALRLPLEDVEAYHAVLSEKHLGVVPELTDLIGRLTYFGRKIEIKN